MISRKYFTAIILLLNCILTYSQPKVPPRERLLLDYEWRFAYGHTADSKKDFDHATSYFSYLAKAGYGDGAASANFDDRSWRMLDLPHDWAVEQEFDSTASFSHGFKAIGKNFPGRSVGWYRKKFSIPASDLGKRISIEFDGAFRNAAVWVNGHYLGTEPSGYNSFAYEITDLLNYGSNNSIAVRVDAAMEEGWFYEGAGIYRHVWLSKTHPIHVMKDGTFVTSSIHDAKASIHCKTEISNDQNRNASIQIAHVVLDRNNNVVTRTNPQEISLSPFQELDINSSMDIENPILWNLESPNLYKLVTTLKNGDSIIDEYSTSFGIRSIRFDAKEGFFLNGKHIKIKGTNNHQDHAGVGTAIPDQLQYWRIQQLKEMGSNAYRCSHNPPTPELLKACDELGMLVIDENRLMRSTKEGLKEMERMIHRDRNHPSVISWSIGNEEWAIENNMVGARIASTLQEYAKTLDSTRIITAGISGGFGSGISDMIDIMGYNYMGNGDIEAHQKRFPRQPGWGTEEGSTFATRGVYFTDDAKHYRAAYDLKPRPTFYSIEEGWKFYNARPYLAGMFIWTGFDYRGEPTPYGWPSITSYFGMMDLCGFPKDNFYYLRSWWSDKPTLHVLPHWNWHGKEGQPFDVWVYSNCDEVELFLNKKSQGRKKMEKNGHLEWKVPYRAGTLEAIGYKNGRKILHDKVITAGPEQRIQLTTQQLKIKANRQDLSVIKVSASDLNGLMQPNAGNEIIFNISGPGKIIGVGNGDPTSLEKDRFIEEIERVAIEQLMETESIDIHSVDTPSNKQWKKAFVTRNYKALANAYITRGYFTLPNNFSSSDINFFYNNIGIEQTIYINGNKIAEGLKTSPSEGFRLEKNDLHAGRNEMLIISTPIPKKHDWETVNSDPGIIQLVTPAQAWKRKLFNGLAQVIVQSTGEPGEIILTASSPGLQTATIKITAEKNNQ